MKQKNKTPLTRPRWVIKAGSEMVCGGGLLLLRSWMQQVAELRKKFGVEVIWVTSGAIATAMKHTHFKGKKRTLSQKQALSAIGQPMIMNEYSLALQASGLMGSQVLLTAGDMKDQTRRLNLQNTLKELLSWKVVPVINENDAVATDEIRFGDNDTLSAQIATMMKAERLIILTDVEGLYDSDPKKNKKAQLIQYKKKLNLSDLKQIDLGSTSKLGTGGMHSKLLAASHANKKGIITHLVKGDKPNNLIHIAHHIAIGTQIGGPLARTKY